MFTAIAFIIMAALLALIIWASEDAIRDQDRRQKQPRVKTRISA